MVFPSIEDSIILPDYYLPMNELKKTEKLDFSYVMREIVPIQDKREDYHFDTIKSEKEFERKREIARESLKINPGVLY